MPRVFLAAICERPPTPLIGHQFTHRSGRQHQKIWICQQKRKNFYAASSFPSSVQPVLAYLGGRIGAVVLADSISVPHT